jgi:hypothetical protein
MANMPARLEAAIAAALADRDPMNPKAPYTVIHNCIMTELEEAFVEARDGRSGLWERLPRQND